MEGLLNKYTNVMKGWQYRWFVMDADSGMLEYFEVSRYIFTIVIQRFTIKYFLKIRHAKKIVRFL